MTSPRSGQRAIAARQLVADRAAARGWSLSQLRLFDPAVRAERKRRRARHALGYRTVATGVAVVVATNIGGSPGPEFGEVSWFAITALAAGATISAGHRVWRLHRTPRIATVAKVDPLPPVGSASYSTLNRLLAREQALKELLTLLGPAAGDAWTDASSAAAALRRLGTQVVALESARAGVPPEAEPGLAAAVAALRSRLEEGVSAYDLVVAAASDAVAAQTEGRNDDALSRRRLAEAADSLAGLARGLREVRDLPPG